jgi:hypothetical protein
MIVDKINVTGDPRVQFRQARVNGKQYGMHVVTSARVHLFWHATRNPWGIRQIMLDAPSQIILTVH